MTPQRFDFAIDPRYARALRLFGVRHDTARIDLDEERLRVRFGSWRFETAVANVGCVQLTGPYRSALRAIGPHISLRDRGLSFGTNIRSGVCVLFRRPVPSRETLGLVHHPGLTVTPATPEDFATALEATRDAAAR